MDVFENDIFARRIAAQPGSGKPKAMPLAIAKGAAKVSAPAAKVSARAVSAPASEGFKGVFEAEVRSLPPRSAVAATLAAKSAAGFTGVFEAGVRSLPPRPGASGSPPAQIANAGGGYQPVFENDVLTPLPPGAAGKNVALWDNGGFGFSDILDVINPLHHLPIISTVYRAETGDQIGAVPRILGSMLYGGGLLGAAIGAATAVINLAVENETGKDIGAHIYTAIFGEGGKNARSTTIATKPGATKPGQISPAIAKSAPVAIKAKPVTATTAPPAPAPAAKAGPPGGGVRVIAKGAPASLSAAAAKSVSSQFRRSTWYRKNQDALAAQARELARAKAAAQARAAKQAGAGKPVAKPLATAKPDILRLFAGGKAGKSGAAARSNHGIPKSIPKAAMAAEMGKAMEKYERLLKSRIADGARVN